MDELAQGNREVAQTVLATNVSHDLARTATMSPLAARLAARTSATICACGSPLTATPNTQGVGPAYDQVRLRILSTIVETTPERISRIGRAVPGRRDFFPAGQPRRGDAVVGWRCGRSRVIPTPRPRRTILKILEPGRWTSPRCGACCGGNQRVGTTSTTRA